MRKILRALAALPLAAFFFAVPAAAAPSGSSNCTITAGLTCQLVNQYGEAIAGFTHGAKAVTQGTGFLSDNWNYTDLHLGWGNISSNVNGLCWNELGGFIYFDACQNDHNELFFIQQSGTHFVIYNYALGTGTHVWGDSVDGQDIEFATGVDNHTLWDQLRAA